MLEPPPQTPHPRDFMRGRLPQRTEGPSPLPKGRPGNQEITPTDKQIPTAPQVEKEVFEAQKLPKRPNQLCKQPNRKCTESRQILWPKGKNKLNSCTRSRDPGVLPVGGLRGYRMNNTCQSGPPELGWRGDSQNQS